MAYPKSAKAVNRYQTIGITAELMDATPHRLVQMLLNGALDKIAAAKGALERNDIAEKGRFITWSITIVNGLKASLDVERGGEIAANLESLYDYMTRQLIAANIENDLDKLLEVSSLLSEIRDAWAAMPDEVKATSNIEQLATG